MLLVAGHSYMAFWAGKIELIELKTGIGGKKSKPFLEMGDGI